MGERYPYSETTERIAYLRYAARFTAVYGAFLLVLALVSMAFKIDMPSFMSFVILMVGGIYVGGRFYMDHQRMPEKLEKRQLALLSLAGSLLVSALPIGILVMANDEMIQSLRNVMQQPAGAGILTLSIAVALLFSYLAIALGIRQGARVQDKARARAE